MELEGRPPVEMPFDGKNLYSQNEVHKTCFTYFKSTAEMRQEITVKGGNLPGILEDEGTLSVPSW